jgi:hypothetical protein
MPSCHRVPSPFLTKTDSRPSGHPTFDHRSQLLLESEALPESEIRGASRARCVELQTGLSPSSRSVGRVLIHA